jgi:hypothetical protein
VEKPAPEPALPPARIVSGAVLLRRALIVLTATLIVARPLVLGEELGLSDHLADPWGMVLILLWLLAAFGWAVWRFWLRSAPPAENDPSMPNPRHWYGGAVQTALLATVALVFVSAEVAASYKFPARLIAWEWFGLFLGFLVVRQLAVTPTEQRGLFAILLASAVALSAQGLYQALFVMPQDRQLVEDPAAFRATWAEMNPLQEVSDNQLEQLRQRALQNNIFGPYAHPNSFAGFLVLWLPGLIGAVVIFRRTQGWSWQTFLAAGCALLGLTALWLTHSRGAMLGLAVAGGGVGLVVGRHALRRHAGAVVVGFLVLAGLIYAVWRSDLLTTGIGKTSGTVAQRLEYWQTTWQMIREHPWLGVGPGNFGEHYTRLMPVTADEKIRAPHNLALELWATCGLFALLTLLAALAAFFTQVVRWLGGWVVNPQPPNHLTTQPPNHLTTQPPEIRWEFYLGGMFGLLLGFVLRIYVASPSTIVTETWAAAVRAVVWFAAYGLLERLDWSPRARVLALTTGIGALLVNLCVSDGIAFPALAGLLWVGVALALNAVELKPVAWLSRAGAAVILPVPIFAGLLLAYGIYILYPILAADGLVREAITAVAFYQEEGSKPPAQRVAVLRNDPDKFIQQKVIQRLVEATRLTPDDARLWVQLAWWTGNRWDLRRHRLRRADPELEKQALEYGKRAVRLDPHGAGGYLVQYRLRMDRFGRAFEEEAHQQPNQDPLFVHEKVESARKQYELAARTLEQFLPNDPHDAALHYGLTEGWFKAGDKAKGQEHAVEALRLDDLASLPARKLTDPQREQVRKWLQAPPGS